MKYGIYTLNDIDLRDKTVLLRVDINQPIDRDTNSLKDITRIKAALPTIQQLHAVGAKVVIMAHQGSDIEYDNFYTTEPHSKVLSDLLKLPVEFIDDVCGPTARQRIKTLKSGEILLLDNVRFISEEQTLFEKHLNLSREKQAETLLVRTLAPLADVYVCDAFAAAHRNQPSLCGFEIVLPSVMGRLFEKEYQLLSEIMENPKRDCVFVLGGGKIADAFGMMNQVLENGVADYILTGGVVGNILLASAGINIGKASLNFIKKQGYDQFIEKGRTLLSNYPEKIILPKDTAFVNEGKRLEITVDQIPDEYSQCDIGSKTADDYTQIIKKAKTIFVNGPMGIFEAPETELGTKRIWQALSDTSAYTVLGGGDSITAANKYGVTEKMDYVCTGGGALIRFLSGEELPVISALKESGVAFKQNFS